MTIKIQSLLKQEAETEIVFFDERGTVTYRPGAITDDMFERVQAAVDDANENVLNRMMAEICVSWDVVDDAGEMVPFTPEALSMVPIPFKAAVLEQIVEAARGNSRASNAPSRVGSRRRGR